MASSTGWSEEEVRKLVDAMSQVELAESSNEENQKTWGRVIELMGTSRSAKAVKARWRKLVKSNPSLQPKPEPKPELKPKPRDTRSACTRVWMNKALRDRIIELGDFKPCRRKDQHVMLTLLEMGVYTRDELRDDYYIKTCGYNYDGNKGIGKGTRNDFVLYKWETMSLHRIQDMVNLAHPPASDEDQRLLMSSGGLRSRQVQFVYPPGWTPVRRLRSKDEVLKQYRCLTYIPREVYSSGLFVTTMLRSAEWVRPLDSFNDSMTWCLDS